MPYNSAQLIEEFGPQATFLEILSSVERQMANSGKVVCQVILNGIKLDERAESSYYTLPVNEINEIDFVVAEQEDLITKLIQNWIETLPTLIKSCDYFSKKILTQGIQGHFEEFKDFIELSEYFVVSLIELENVLATEFAHSSAWTCGELEIKRAVEQALGAFERKDYQELAEILEYDFAEGLSNWLNLLKSINFERDVA